MLLLGGLLVPVGGVLLAHFFLLRRPVAVEDLYAENGPASARRRLRDPGYVRLGRGRGGVLSRGRRPAGRCLRSSTALVVTSVLELTLPRAGVENRGVDATRPAASSTSTWTRSTLPWSSATIPRCAAGPSRWAGTRRGAASSPPRATRHGSSACARRCRWRAPCASARISRSCVPTSGATPPSRGRSSTSTAPSRRSSSRSPSTRRTST